MPTLFNQSLDHAVPASDLPLGLVIGLHVAYQQLTNIKVKIMSLTASLDDSCDEPLFRNVCNSTIKFKCQDLKFQHTGKGYILTF